MEARSFQVLSVLRPGWVTRGSNNKRVAGMASRREAASRGEAAMGHKEWRGYFIGLRKQHLGPDEGAPHADGGENCPQHSQGVAGVRRREAGACQGRPSPPPGGPPVDCTPSPREAPSNAHEEGKDASLEEAACLPPSRPSRMEVADDVGAILPKRSAVMQGRQGRRWGIGGVLRAFDEFVMLVEAAGPLSSSDSPECWRKWLGGGGSSSTPLGPGQGKGVACGEKRQGVSLGGHKSGGEGACPAPATPPKESIAGRGDEAAKKGGSRASISHGPRALGVLHLALGAQRAATSRRGCTLRLVICHVLGSGV